ncbi:unnamed protein product [Sphenostylis stenocarpa]|uniref:V-type proton ATPase subunit E n=1 Tax=Sphenostylis stenocarpa TaxID=92480 RepID=A0AA86VBM4_9FABA|nr:unnamed protein product [Sphenostylis stenocarpa]
MNDADVSRQIQQMVRFIRQEAEEKANEISVSAEEVSLHFTVLSSAFQSMPSNRIVFFLLQEFNIEKLQLVEAEKKKIRQEYERKERQVEIRKKISLSNGFELLNSRMHAIKVTYDISYRILVALSYYSVKSIIKLLTSVANYLNSRILSNLCFEGQLIVCCSEYSMQLNASRIKVLQAQDDVISSMKEAASKELLSVSHHHHLTLSHHDHVYRNLLKDLIIQCLLRLKEPSVLLRCRKDDLHLVEHVLDSAGQEYAGKANVEPPEIIVDNQVYLPPGPSHHNPHDIYCSGGVVLASRDGKIVCENTLDARLDVVFRKKLPEIRKQLFGQVVA